MVFVPAEKIARMDAPTATIICVQINLLSSLFLPTVWWTIILFHKMVPRRKHPLLMPPLMITQNTRFMQSSQMRCIFLAAHLIQERSQNSKIVSFLNFLFGRVLMFLMVVLHWRSTITVLSYFLLITNIFILVLICFEEAKPYSSCELFDGEKLSRTFSTSYTHQLGKLGLYKGNPTTVGSSESDGFRKVETLSVDGWTLLADHPKWQKHFFLLLALF